MGVLLFVFPVLGMLVFFLVNKKFILDCVNVIISFAMLLVGLVLTMDVLKFGRVSYSFSANFFFIDAFSIIILDIVLIISFMTGVYSIGYLNEELKSRKINLTKTKIYYILMYTFIFTMILSLTVKNMGIMWIAIEATTLASVFLVGFYNDKQAIEAAWKYIIICSVGIAIALLGIIFLHLSYTGLDLQLDWTSMYANARSMNTPSLRLAFIFILIGFGTKAGLAPMHTWLPDAHSQAPSPISAMLSGVLLNSAIYAIIRTQSILNKNMGTSEFSGRLLILLGLISISIAAIFILTQKDYKRLLAFSSIEHIGIIALSFGIFTPASIIGALFHMINHSFTKSMLFLTAGNVLLKYDTKNIRNIKGVLKTLPVSGIAMFLGLFAISGTPPFSIFTSEFAIIFSIFEVKQYLLGVVLILLLTFVFVGIAFSTFKMFYPGKENPEIKNGELNVSSSAVISVLLVIITITGLYIPDGVKQLIINAQKIISGG